MKITKLGRWGLVLMGLWSGDLAHGNDAYVGTLYLSNRVVTVGNLVSIGNAATYGVAPGVVIGLAATGTYWAISVGPVANGDNVGTAIGVCNFATNWGTAVGYRTDGSSYGVAIGSYAMAPGMGNVALGGTPYAVPLLAAAVPASFTDTIELGRGTAVLNGGLNFRGYGLANSNGVVVAAIDTTNPVVASTATISNLTITGQAFLPAQGDLGMGSFTNRPGL